MKVLPELACTIAALAVFAPAPTVFAQAYPTKPIRLILPFPPGGPTDIAGRTIAQKLSEQIQQPVVPENRPGATSNIGLELAAKSPPDGYTIVLTPPSISLSPSMYKKLNYDAARDFQPLSLVANMYYVMATHNSVPAKNLKEFIALAKSSPGKLNFSSSGLGAGNHLATELLRSMYGLQMVHIPYKGNVAGLLACMTGEVDFGTFAVAPAIPVVKDKKVRPLAALTEKRLGVLPDVPTAREQGVDLVSVQWYAILTSAGTPRPVVDRLVSEIHKAVLAPEVKDKLGSSGIDTVTSTPEQLRELIRSETVRYAKVIKAAGIKPE
ncbi:MAG TPA: tripartite tricarboxylate transporter substrate binding protein [Burkholderiales bacterium]|nr:tripartite tricarboxylate transporter substrate binding protein [Burkholderiales bacterium]